MEVTAGSDGCAGALIAAVGVVEAGPVVVVVVAGTDALGLDATGVLAFPLGFVAEGGVEAAAAVLRNDVLDGVPVLLSGTSFGEPRTLLTVTGADAVTAAEAGGAE